MCAQIAAMRSSPYAWQRLRAYQVVLRSARLGRLPIGHGTVCEPGCGRWDVGWFMIVLCDWVCGVTGGGRHALLPWLPLPCWRWSARTRL